MLQIWPEHFDAALDLAVSPDVRVNLGGSPGDDGHPEPYLYVGPWTSDRPGDAAFWNAPFGAVLGHDVVAGSDDPLRTACSFFERGIEQLRAR